MPARLISEARRRLQELASGANSEQYRQMQAELDAASGVALARATDYADKAVSDVMRDYERQLQEWAALRDEVLALVQTASAGTTDSRSVNAELQRLRQVVRSRAGHVEEVGKTLALVERIEEDPEAWHDDLANRLPNMRIDFSW